jgi:RNA polymerase sigma factor (sigma-70 family)
VRRCSTDIGGKTSYKFRRRPNVEKYFLEFLSRFGNSGFLYSRGVEYNCFERKPDMTNEIELLHKCLKGSNDAFGGIVAKYQSLVCAITYSATGDTALSEDLAQEAFVNAWKNLAQLKDLSKFRAWLCSIARNVVCNHLREKKHDVAVRGVPMDSFDNIPHNGTEPAEGMINREQEAVVREALGRIPEEYREPLVLFYREEQSVREVAAQLELSEDAVRTRLSRARLMLKNEVEMIIETTIGRSRPGKAFTTAVTAGIAGIGIEASGAAGMIGVAPTVTGEGPGATTAAVGSSTKMAGSTFGIKIAVTSTMAAIIIAGLVLSYKHRHQSGEPDDSARIVAAPNDIQSDTTNTRMTDMSKSRSVNVAMSPVVPLASASTAADSNTRSTDPQPGPNPRLISISPSPDTRWSKYTELKLTFDQPMLFEVGKVKMDSDTQYGEIQNCRSYDSATNTITIPLCTSGPIDLEGFKSLAGTIADPCTITYIATTKALPDDLEAMIGQPNVQLISLINNIQAKRKQIFALSETVQAIGTDNSKLYTAHYSFQSPDKFVVEFDEPNQKLAMGSDGQKCWYYNKSSREGMSWEYFSMLDLNLVTERIVRIAEVFSPDANAASIINKEKLINLDFEQELNAYHIQSIQVGESSCRIVDYYIDAISLLPVKVVGSTPYGCWIFNFKYDSINNALDPVIFKIPETSVEPTTPEPLNPAAYDRYYVQITDGSDSSINLWFGQKGPAGSRNGGMSLFAKQK